MAQVTYNRVVFPYPMFTQFEQIAKRDGEGDTDSIGVEYHIGVQCLITASYLPLLAPDLVDNQNFASVNPADIMAIVRSRLLQPRKQLSVKFNGVELIPYAQSGAGGNPFPQTPDNIDAMNGPKPQHCRIINLTNNSFLLTWAVKAHYVDKLIVSPFGDPLRYDERGSPILYNRWSEELYVNNLNLCRRSRKGKFMIRSDNVQRKIADQFSSQFAILGVPQGWLRESSSYTVDPSGLAISYEITDKQQYKMPPEPAYEAEGDFIESTSTEGGKVYGDCRVLLRGSGVGPAQGQAVRVATTDPQAVLCNLAVAVAMNKMSTCLAGEKIAQRLKINPNKLILQNASLRMSLWKCEVEFNCRFMASREKPLVSYLPFSHLDTQVYQQERIYTPSYPIHGSAGFLVQAAAYYDPSLAAELPAWDGSAGQWVGGIEPGKGFGGKT